jgi:hypothetical protein
VFYFFSLFYKNLGPSRPTFVSSVLLSLFSKPYPMLHEFKKYLGPYHKTNSGNNNYRNSDGLTRRESNNDNNNQMLREVPPMRFLILELQWGAKGIDKADIYST